MNFHGYIDKIEIIRYNKFKENRDQGESEMKNLKRNRLIYVVLSVIVLILNTLPIVIKENAALSKYSIIYIAFALCSVVYAVIAFIFKDKGNLFVAGKYWFYRALSLSFSENKDKDDEEYKKEFELSAFIYCVTIPTYITFAFFANGFYSAFLQALGWTIFRLIAIIIFVIIPPIIKNIKEKKQQRIKDEADRKEQERRESMGKWK